MRVLLLATTTGYQVRSFGHAAARLGVEIVFATDRCHRLDDPWVDGAIPIRFFDEEQSTAEILSSLGTKPDDPIRGVLAVGDQPTGIAARVAAALRLPWHPLAATAVSRNKQRTRECLEAAGEPVPWFRPVPLDTDATALATRLAYPCIVKPLALSASRGVIRANGADEFVGAFDRVRRLLRSSDVRATRLPDLDVMLVEGYVPGIEIALEAVMEHGSLVPLAIFDKPDPLEGPFFEETIYVTPSRLSNDEQERVVAAVARAARAMGLTHGPIHAECRLHRGDIVVLEIAARPIGGLCSQSLRFDDGMSLEELLLRHALGESVKSYRREQAASAVMMIPIPAAGVFRRMDGVTEASAVPGVEQIQITAKPDQTLVPLPEGATYLGFIFARGDGPEDAERAVRQAYGRLAVVMDRQLTLAGSC